MAGQDQDVALQCRYSAGGVAHVLFSVSVGSSAVLTDLLARMNDGGMPTRDISGIEAAQVPVQPHLRVGSPYQAASDISGWIATCAHPYSLQMAGL